MDVLSKPVNWTGKFKAITDPAGIRTVIPDDLTIIFPSTADIAAADAHVLAYIPWDEKYLKSIPVLYRTFYESIVLHLGVRTTDVHTALSMRQLAGLVSNTEQTVNIQVLTLAILLHDCGWSEVSTAGIVNSLNYSGVAPTIGSRKSKQQHVIFGEALAYKILDNYNFAADGLPVPTSDDIFQITEIIRRHDFDASWETNKFGPISLETKLVCDCDRLWSYTHENFWQDTIRKAVAPDDYLRNLGTSIDSYFFTPQGKARARRLLAQRRHEVALYSSAWVR